MQARWRGGGEVMTLSTPSNRVGRAWWWWVVSVWSTAASPHPSDPLRYWSAARCSAGCSGCSLHAALQRCTPSRRGGNEASTARLCSEWDWCTGALGLCLSFEEKSCTDFSSEIIQNCCWFNLMKSEIIVFFIYVWILDKLIYDNFSTSLSLQFIIQCDVLW